MELTEILAIAGKPGLYKFVAQSKNGIIVESLADKSRTMVGGSVKVSALGDIAMFTANADIPLADIFQSLYDKNNGPVAANGKSEAPELEAFMEQALPEYDRERVHLSDIRKLAQWYNTLVAAGMTSFKPAEEATEAAETDSEKKPATAKAKAAAAAKSGAAAGAAKKQAAPKPTGAKTGTARSTTARKAQ